MHSHKKKQCPNELPTKLWEIVCADIFLMNNKTLLCIVDYYSKFPFSKRANGLTTDDLIRGTKLMFVEFGLPPKSIKCRPELCVRLF